MAKYSYHQTDKTQAAIVAAMTKAGATVWKIGRPVDLLVACQGQTALAECKTATGKLNAFQDAFLAAWPGVWRVVRTPEDGVALVADLKRLATAAAAAVDRRLKLVAEICGSVAGRKARRIPPPAY